MTIETQPAFNKTEFTQGYLAALAQVSRPREETVQRPDVDFIVKEIKSNPANLEQILAEAQNRWDEAGTNGRADGNTRNLYRIQLELVVAKLARQDIVKRQARAARYSKTKHSSSGYWRYSRSNKKHFELRNKIANVFAKQKLKCFLQHITACMRLG